jgi:hypothetical protein
MKPRPQLLILMLFPSFNMHHKYRGPGSKSRIDIVLRYGTKVNLNQKLGPIGVVDGCPLYFADWKATTV